MTLVIFECEAKEGCMDQLKSTLKGLLPDTVSYTHLTLPTKA